MKSSELVESSVRKKKPRAHEIVKSSELVKTSELAMSREENRKE